MSQRKRPVRRSTLIGALMVAAAVAALALWLAVPRPIVSQDAFIPSGAVITVWRLGDHEVREVDEALAGELLACLRQYSATPFPTMDYAPREMPKIPFELEFTCIDGRRGPKHIVLGKDFFWYRSTSLPYVIHDGEALLDQITALAGIPR